MRLKKKPVEPVRKKIELSMDLPEGKLLDVFSEIQRKITEKFQPIDEPRIVLKYDYDYSEALVVWEVWEDDSTFQERVAKYDIQVAEYNEWYAANREEIEKEIEARKNKTEHKKKQKQDKLAAQIKKMQEELNKL